MPIAEYSDEQVEMSRTNTHLEGSLFTCTMAGFGISCVWRAAEYPWRVFIYDRTVGLHHT